MILVLLQVLQIVSVNRSLTSSKSFSISSWRALGIIQGEVIAFVDLTKVHYAFTELNKMIIQEVIYFIRVCHQINSRHLAFVHTANQLQRADTKTI